MVSLPLLVNFAKIKLRLKIGLRQVNLFVCSLVIKMNYQLCILYTTCCKGINVILIKQWSTNDHNDQTVIK